MADEERSSGSERAPSRAETLRRAVRAMASELRVCLPGAIHKWDASKQRAEVKILVKLAYLDEEDNRQVESFPIVPGVVVQFQGAGLARLTLPLCDGQTAVESGDIPPATTGTLFFSDLSLDRWLSGQGQEVDPEIDHFHDIADAIFMPGLMPFGAPWGTVPTDHATLGVDTGTLIHLRKNKVVVAKDEINAQFVALSNLVDNRIAAIRTYINAHVHSGVFAGSSNTGAPTGTLPAQASTAAAELQTK